MDQQAAEEWEDDGEEVERPAYPEIYRPVALGEDVEEVRLEPDLTAAPYEPEEEEDGRERPRPQG